MKTALTVWENRISPVFDSACKFLLVDIENKAVISRHSEKFYSETPSHRAKRLFDLGIMVLICGAISESPANMIEAHGIKLIPFITGSVDDVLNAYIKGNLTTPIFLMPGCGFRYCKQFRRDCSSGDLKRIRNRNNSSLLTENALISLDSNSRSKLKEFQSEAYFPHFMGVPSLLKRAANASPSRQILSNSSPRSCPLGISLSD